MIQHGDNDSLLAVLKRLYSKLARVALHKRMSSYQQWVNTENHQDISNPLYDYIDKLASSDAVKAPGVPHQTYDKEQPAIATNNTTPPAAQEHKEIVINKTLEGLSLYYQDHKTAADSQPELSEKLKKSAWEHIHAVHRYARQGDVKTARLHADIANNALKEAAHYMTEDDYKAFMQEVKDEMQAIK